MFLFSFIVCLDLFSLLLTACNHFKSLQLLPISLLSLSLPSLCSSLFPSRLFWGSLSSPSPIICCRHTLGIVSRRTLLAKHTAYRVCQVLARRLKVHKNERTKWELQCRDCGKASCFQLYARPEVVDGSEYWVIHKVHLNFECQPKPVLASCSL